MTTKLPRPHYSPEICSIVTMLNFNATEEGLVDQMLNIIVIKEDPNTEKTGKKQLKKCRIKKLSKAKEEEILKLVTTNKEDNFGKRII